MTYELESFYYHCSVQPRRKTKLSAAPPLNQSPHDKSSVEGRLGLNGELQMPSVRRAGQ